MVLSTETLCGSQVTELECVSGQTAVIKAQKTDLNQTIEELQATLGAKEEVFWAPMTQQEVLCTHAFLNRSLWSWVRWFYAIHGVLSPCDALCELWASPPVTRRPM